MLTGPASATRTSADYTPVTYTRSKRFSPSTPWWHAIPNYRLGRNPFSVLLVRADELRVTISTTSKPISGVRHITYFTD